MTYILSQIIGGIVAVIVFLSMQTKNITRVMLCQIGCNALGMLSYVLLGGFSGCGIYLIATVRSLVFFFLRKYDKREPMWINIVFIISYIACSVLTYETVRDIVPMIAAVLCALGLIQKKTTNYRIIMFLNGATWIVYDVIISAFTMLASKAIIGFCKVELH